MHKARIQQVAFKLAQFATMPQHQLTQTVQLRYGESGQVGIVQNIGAVFVVIRMRNVCADLMQAASPNQFALHGRQVICGCSGWDFFEEQSRRVTHALCLLRINAKTLGQPFDHRLTNVGTFIALEQVVQGALTQGALRGMQFIDVEQFKQGHQDGQSTANHGTSVFFDAVEFQLIRATRFDQLLFEPIQAFTGDGACRPTRRFKHVHHGANGA